MEVNCTEFFPYARVLCHGLAKLKTEERQMKEKMINLEIPQKNLKRC